MIITAASVVVVGLALGYWFYSSSKPLASTNVDYQDISVTQLNEMLKSKDFVLVDVHIPEQVHIPQTDKFIAYNEIDRLVEALPDKKQKIVFYCRSGSMSAYAAEKLSELGYQNLFNLAGGMNAWQAAGLPTIPIGSMNQINP